MRYIYGPEKFFIIVDVRVCADQSFNNDDHHLFFFEWWTLLGVKHFQVISSELKRQNYMTKESKSKWIIIFRSMLMWCGHIWIPNGLAQSQWKCVRLFVFGQMISLNPRAHHWVKWAMSDMWSRSCEYKIHGVPFIFAKKKNSDKTIWNAILME